MTGFSASLSSLVNSGSLYQPLVSLLRLRHVERLPCDQHLTYFILRLSEKLFLLLQLILLN